MSGAVAVRPVARAPARVAPTSQVQGPRVVKRRWIDAQRARAFDILTDPTSTAAARSAARAWLNRAWWLRQELRPVPLMKCGLDIDKVPRGFRR